MTRVSVAMAVRDVEAYVDEALDSVLDQIGLDDEVVVVDDGSTDATPHLLAARGERIVHVRKEPTGLGAARNRCLDHCSGRYVTFLDGDDCWAPGALERLVTGLESHPTATGVVGLTDEFLDPAVTDRTAARLRAPVSGVRGHLFGSMLLRREIFEAVRFDPGTSASSSADWLARARAHGLHLEPLDAVILHRRLRPGSLTTDTQTYQRDLLATLRASLARSRRP